MRFKSLVSPLALVIGLGVVGAAVAQDAPAEGEMTWTIENGAMMIDGVALDEEQAGYVQAYCDDLQENFENEGITDADGEEEDSTEEESPLADVPTSMIDFDLSQLTRDDCIEAGFITE